MCGRFTLFASPEEVAEQFGLETPPVLAPRYNIAPTQPVGFVRRGADGARVWELGHWGLIPSWSKDPSIGARMINARSETAAEKPSFRAAMRRRRCLIPTTGFYEWKRINGAKQPYYIHLAGGGLFAFAGLWEYWAGEDGSELVSCTILTTEANEMMAGLHNRMPSIILPDDYDDWLGDGRDADAREVDRLKHLLRPAANDLLEAEAVSRYVNSPSNEGEACILPLT